jgi:hypothetical protein
VTAHDSAQDAQLTELLATVRELRSELRELRAANAILGAQNTAIARAVCTLQTPDQQRLGGLPCRRLFDGESYQSTPPGGGALPDPAARVTAGVTAGITAR